MLCVKIMRDMTAKLQDGKKTMQSMCIKTEHFNTETPQSTLYYEKNA